MNFEIATRRMPLRSDSAEIFRSLFAASPYAFWLDSNSEDKEYARFSFLGDCSGPHAYRLHNFVSGNTLVVRNNGTSEEFATNLFEFLEQQLNATKVKDEEDLPFNFRGGFVGYLGYELMFVTENVHGHTSSLPDATLLFVDRFLAVDHATDSLYLIALHRNDASAAEDWFIQIESALAEIKPSKDRHFPIVSLCHPHDVEPYLLHDRTAYLHQIAAVKEQIIQGQCYEVCLTNRVRLPIAQNGAREVLRAYLALRHINPAPYACFLRLDSISVLCSSPERFLKTGQDGVVEARPIKGTIGRGVDSVEDDANKQRLLSDERFFSENLMIVDLLRNDLSRTCVPGSVHVPALMQVESYATVHQLVSTVRGTLQQSPVQCVARCFPGGSMTGAPKKRTLEIINALEGSPRGIYSGAIGYFSLNGTVDLNVVIRTIVLNGSIAEIGVGGAVIHLSNAEEEYNEMLLKALAPFSAMATLAAVSPPYPTVTVEEREGPR
jgi:anthranilate/para-aminobenzoate synthase component I